MISFLTFAFSGFAKAIASSPKELRSYSHIAGLLALRPDEARELGLLRVAPGLHAQPLLVEIRGLHGECEIGRAHV